MTKYIYEIEYRLTLCDNRRIETSTRVAAKSGSEALTRLEVWRKQQSPKYTNIEYTSIRKEWCEVVL